MSWWDARSALPNMDWDRKAHYVREETQKSYREAARQDETARTTPTPVESAEGYINGEGSKVKGPSWEGPKDGEWREGAHLTWLYGSRCDGECCG